MHSVNITDFFTKGRPGDPRLGEEVESPASPSFSECKNPIVLMGCPDDTGVLRNRGRAGAKKGPDSIRKHLYKMTAPMHFDWRSKLALFDAGNIEVGKSISETHRNARAAAKGFSTAKTTLITLGGGHDFASPNFLGCIEGKKTKKAGLINVDPHLDVRELEENLPHSGTPFRQILESELFSPKNMIQFGTRSNRNAKFHYEWCKNKKVKILSWDEIRSKPHTAAKQFTSQLSTLAKTTELIGVTIDIDCCESAEGSSAAPVLGFSATELYFMARAAGLQKKVQYFEICEVAPELDSTERSSRIAAELIYAFLEARASIL